MRPLLPFGVGSRRVLPAVVLFALMGVGGAACATPIDDKYAALGGSRGFLGSPTIAESSTPDGAGRFRHYQRGSIYWTSRTGAHVIHGLIRDKWSALGWERSFLGYPTTDEETVPDRNGSYSHFENGSIYWSAETNRAHEVHGLIKEKWANLGWERGYLGFPITDETATADGKGRFNTFQYGAIHWTPQTGAYVADTPVGSARVRLQLFDVKCSNTEDNLGEDEFYIVGALANGTDVQSALTRSVGINDGQIRRFPTREAGLFNGVVPESAVIRGALVAYDEDCAKDWAKYGDLITGISDLVGAGLTAAGYPTAATVVTAATKVLSGACSVDKDDELGSQSLFVPASGPAVEDVTWQIRHQPSGLFSNHWVYDIRYRIMRAR